jgi:hypothetical protein
MALRLLLVCTAMLGAEYAASLGVRPRYTLAASLVFLLASAVTALRDPGAAWLRRSAWLWVGIPFLLSAMTGLLAEAGGTREFAEGFVPFVVGAASFLLLAADGGSAQAAESGEVSWVPGSGSVAVLVLLSFVEITWLHARSFGTGVLIGDETFYRLQAAWLDLPGFAPKIPLELRDSFANQYSTIVGDHLIGQYTIGWPTVLWFFRRVGLEWWTNAVLGAATCLAVYVLGHRVAGRRVGLIAAVRLCVNPWFTFLFVGYMSHGLTILCVLGAVLLLLPHRGGTDVPTAYASLAAGALLGLAVAARPPTGAACAMGMGLWLLASGPQFRRLWFVAAMAVGMVPAVVWMLVYNDTTLGTPLTFGYHVVHGSLHDLGFGLRGIMQIDPARGPVPAAWPFTPTVAARHLFDYLTVLTRTFVPYSMLLPLVAVHWNLGGRVPRVLLAAFAPLLVMHLAWWYAHARFMAELLPFVLVASAIVVDRALRTRPAFGRGLLAALVLGGVVLNLPGREKAGRFPEPRIGWTFADDQWLPGAFTRIEEIRAGRGPLLLLVNDAVHGVFSPGLNRLALFNQRGLESDIVVARDLGRRNSALLNRLPGRTVVCVRSVQSGPAEFTILSGNGLALASATPEAGDVCRVGAAGT